MVKSLSKNRLLCSSIILLFASLFTSSTEIQEPLFSVGFKLLNKESQIDAKNQFKAVIIFKNLNNPSIKIDPHLQIGFNGDDPFTVMAYDLNNKEVDISTFMDYDYFFHDDLLQFKRGDIICDTISADPFYHFKSKGTYKVRLLFEPENLYVPDQKLSGQYIFSNWDTLVIK
jgi:hypothetical protein